MIVVTLQVKTWFQNRRMKHKKHLRKQSSGRTSVTAGESEEKDSSDYEDIQGDGEEEQEEEGGELSNAKYACAENNIETKEINTTKRDLPLDTSLEGNKTSSRTF